jgi:hypothetical protein
MDWIIAYLDTRKSRLVDAILLLAAGTNSLLIFEHLIETRHSKHQYGQVIFEEWANNHAPRVLSWIHSKARKQSHNLWHSTEIKKNPRLSETKQ